MKKLFATVSYFSLAVKRCRNKESAKMDFPCFHRCVLVTVIHSPERSHVERQLDEKYCYSVLEYARVFRRRLVKRLSRGKNSMMIFLLFDWRVVDVLSRRFKSSFVYFHLKYVQRGKKRFFLAVIDEFCVFSLMEIHVKNLPQIFEFQDQNFLLHCILLITETRR